MKFKADESTDKLRGGYYTPDDISRFLTRWVLSASPRSLLEPSCGDGSFIRALQGEHTQPIAFTGIEILETEANKARAVAKENTQLTPTIENRDFLEWFLEKTNTNGIGEASERYDAVLGNPPYIRYQYLEPQDQIYSETIFKQRNLAFTKHTNAWVPFIIASLDLLKPGGRLAMVIPAEILHVLHANSLRQYLISQCHKIVLVDPNELLFDDALQGTVLIMAEKKTDPEIPSLGVSVVAAPNNAFLMECPESLYNAAQCVSGDQLNGKWMKVLLTSQELAVLNKAQSLPSIKVFADIAKVDVGIVTGANKFFLVNDETVSKYDLHRYTHPMFGRSEHCKGIIYSKATHASNSVKKHPTNFVFFDKVPFDELTEGAQAYIREGEAQSLHTRYKCRIRKPWYTVPSVYTTPVGMLKRSHNYPRLILNTVAAYTTDTAYRITPKVDANAFVGSFVNSLTALSAELQGRHYGGGVLEMVPSEIEKVLIPLVDFTDQELSDLNERIESAKDQIGLVRLQDEKVLLSAGLSLEEADIVHNAWLRIRNRRLRLLSE